MRGGWQTISLSVHRAYYNWPFKHLEDTLNLEWHKISKVMHQLYQHQYQVNKSIHWMFRNRILRQNVGIPITSTVEAREWFCCSKSSDEFITVFLSTIGLLACKTLHFFSLFGEMILTVIPRLSNRDCACLRLSRGVVPMWDLTRRWLTSLPYSSFCHSLVRWYSLWL